MEYRVYCGNCSLKLFLWFLSGSIIAIPWIFKLSLWSHPYYHWAASMSWELQPKVELQNESAGLKSRRGCMLIRYASDIVLDYCDQGQCILCAECQQVAMPCFITALQGFKFIASDKAIGTSCGFDILLINIYAAWDIDLQYNSLTGVCFKIDLVSAILSGMGINMTLINI